VFFEIQKKIFWKETDFRWMLLNFASVSNSESIEILTRLFYIILTFFVLLSCRQENEPDCFFSIPSRGWASDSVAVFQVEYEKNPVSLMYQIGYNENFHWENIWLQYLITDTSGDTIRRSTDNLYLFQPGSGKPLGRGSKERMYLNAYFLRSFQPLKPGKYQIMVRHRMRTDTVRGIQSLRLLQERDK
jgi:gliding motility-associated lipoprotein GldH